MSSSLGKKRKIDWVKWLYNLSILAGVWFAFLNVQPYEKMVRLVSGKVLSAGLVNIVAAIPIVNGIASIFATSITWILGAILWGIIQIIEVLPVILYSHEGFITTVISSADNAPKYQVNDEDDPALKMLKKTYNALPISVISNLEMLKIFTYTVDFLICITVYSPVPSGKFSDFFFILMTGQWGKLDYVNLILAVVTLFAIEGIVSLIIWLGKLSYHIKESSR